LEAVLNKEEYQIYLKSPHWIGLRNDLRGRDEYKSCFICNYKPYELEEETDDYVQKIVLHHCTYENIGREKDSDLVPLCEDCHDLLHFLDRNTNFVNKTDFNKLHIMLRDDASLRRILD
jgi:hypothetical protein